MVVFFLGSVREDPLFVFRVVFFLTVLTALELTANRGMSGLERCGQLMTG